MIQKDQTKYYLMYKGQKAFGLLNPQIDLKMYWPFILAKSFEGKLYIVLHFSDALFDIIKSTVGTFLLEEKTGIETVNDYLYAADV